MSQVARAWTDGMYRTLRERLRAIEPHNYQNGVPPDVGAWDAEVGRLCRALEWLSWRRFIINATEMVRAQAAAKEAAGE